MSSRPRQEICWGCGGSGQQAEKPVATSYHQSSKSVRSRAKTAKPKKPWSRDEKFVFVPAYAASTWGLFEYTSLSGWLPFAVALLPAAIIARTWKGLIVIAIAWAAIWAMDFFSKS